MRVGERNLRSSPNPSAIGAFGRTYSDLAPLVSRAAHRLGFLPLPVHALDRRDLPDVDARRVKGVWFLPPGVPCRVHIAPHPTEREAA